MAEKASGSSGSGASATQEKSSKKDDKRYGGSEPLPYPEHEPLDKVTYRDPRPLDWPQKADRSVFIGVVHQADPEDDPKGDFVEAGKVREDEELELGGDQVKAAQIVAGSNQITVITDQGTLNFGNLTPGVVADLTQALNVVGNS